MNDTATNTLAAEATNVRHYIAFNASGKQDDSPQALLQSEGVAALWHRIEEDNFAYLADEVGMGKTRQAMGVIATTFLRKPNARVVVICPGKPLQEQWKTEWVSFISGCLTHRDGVLKSLFDGQLNMPMALHNRLNEFATTLLMDDSRIHLLRYSSFSRPIGFMQDKTKEKIRSTYEINLQTIGVSQLNTQEIQLFDEVDLKSNWRKKLTKALNTCYAKRLESLLRDEARPIDLIVCDEAQYLRHTGNARNLNIKASLASKHCKWLFISATPLHSSHHDIKSLDKYLCPHQRDKQTHVCNKNGCSNIKAKMEGSFKDDAPLDVVDILSDFLVRRPRQYIDGNGKTYDKVSYREYKPDAARATGDAFASMVTALVQKRLVKRLSGNNNKFRQGECSSFESLASSAGNKSYKDCDGNPHQTPELEHNDKGGDGHKEPIDRFDIDQLNQSLRQTLVDGGMLKEPNKGLFHLPHTKLHHVVDSLSQNSLKNAPNHKTLIFVRRLDTVVELMVLLQQRFQNLIDRRIDDWGKWIKLNNPIKTKAKTFTRHEDFWHKDSTSNDDSVFDEENDNDNSDDEENGATSRAQSLLYYQAISQTKGARGKFASFMASLLQTRKSSKNTLAFLLCDDVQHPTHWKDPDWQAFVDVIYDKPADTAKSWLFDEKHQNDIKRLKRSLLQSMRRSDFIVDLYILHHFVNIQGELTNDNVLTNKLIWLLKQAKTNQFEPAHPDLNQYLNNWRKRLQNWCDHFELISQKCFNNMASINDIDTKFKLMGPVVGRSGSMANKNAVTQFKMPCYPNILVCTDVLKEGVDMHLFCDEVIHYGVAWTSGDLEQRIGRVDRVNSLIHRRIQQHEEQPQSAPKLHAGFPYLDGTLDQHQVKRVIKRKIASDLQMDFGKKAEDIEDISIDVLFDGSDDINKTSADSTLLKTQQFLPKSLQIKGEKLTIDSFDYQANLSVDDYKRLGQALDAAKLNHSGISYRSLHPVAAIEINYQQSNHKADHNITLGDDLATKWTHSKENRQFEWLKNVSCIVSLDTPTKEIFKVIDGLLKAGKALEPTAINKLSYAGNLKFNNKYKTLALTCNEHIAPYQQTKNRKQTVIAEHIGDWLLLRSPIINITELSGTDKNKSLAQWIGQQNNQLRFGYLNDHADIVWFCCLLGCPQNFSEQFNDILNKVAITADRLQQLKTAEDKEVWHYQSANSLNELLPDCSNRADFDALMVNNTNLKRDISRWQRSLFFEVICVIADELGITGKTREEVFANLIHSKRFVQHGQSSIEIPQTPALRFRLANHLDFNDNRLPELPQGYPLMCWEVGINTASSGRSPMLELETWQTLPHSEDTGCEWQNIPSPENTQVFTWQERHDPNRWLVLYHPACLLEGQTEALIKAWKNVARRMRRPSKFARTDCAQIFGMFG